MINKLKLYGYYGYYGYYLREYDLLILIILFLISTQASTQQYPTELFLLLSAWMIYHRALGWEQSTIPASGLTVHWVPAEAIAALGL